MAVIKSLIKSEKYIKMLERYQVKQRTHTCTGSTIHSRLHNYFIPRLFRQETRREERTLWRENTVAYNPWDTVEYATALPLSDWLYGME